MRNLEDVIGTTQCTWRKYESYTMRFQVWQKAKKKGGSWDAAGKVEFIPENNNEFTAPGLGGFLA